MIPRAITDKVKYYTDKYPVITITGPRQSGKTTLVKNIFPEYDYYTMENPLVRAQAQEDPSFLFYPKGKRVIIDEIQRLPDLLSHIQNHADEDPMNGRFIITGSQSMLLSDKVSQTLAGRTAILKLLPFSMSELKAAGIGERKDYEDWIFQGFYPRTFDQSLKPEDFYPFYYETYLQRDVREIQNVRDLGKFSDFVKLCAGRVGQLLDYSSISNDVGVSVNTIRGWISLLEASYVIFLLRPYSSNMNKRVIKAPKLYFTDTGLAAFLLDIQNANQLQSHYLRGNLFENLIISELLKWRYNNAMLSNLYFYRDSNKTEVDCVLDGIIPKAIEIKSAKNFSGSFISGLHSFSKGSGIATQKGYVIYGGEDAFTFKGFNVLSWRNCVDVIQQ